MRVQRLRLRHYRNYTELDFRPGDGLNILAGENAQGKSNLLEAIYLLAISRSLRASRESELVQRGAEEGLASADVCRESDADITLDVAIFQNDKKSIRINGVRRARVLELLGNLNAIYFGSIDLGIVAGEPSLRRRWLNLEISQISPKYCFDLAGYKKVLEQRNRLLRDLRERPYGNSGLEVWNEQLIHYGAPLIEKRRFFVERIAPLADEIHRELTNHRESLALAYQPSIPFGETDSPEAIADGMRAEIARISQEELRRGVTLAGPQRDDLQFLINGADARVYGSQGQQRTVVLSLKLAEFRLMEDYVGEPPVLLLDDVMSDLDDLRRAHLFERLRSGNQTFLTCTNLRAFPSELLKQASVFHVESGHVSPYGAGLPAELAEGEEVGAP